MSLWWLALLACQREPGVVDLDGDGFPAEVDCDDYNPTVFPGAVERPDGLDNDCDGVVDGGQADLDGDGYSVADGDCDDHNASVSPGAVELPGDGVDQDCDGHDSLRVALLEAAAWTAQGPGTGAGFGSALAALDVDSDGVEELIVGAPWASTSNEEGALSVGRMSAHVVQEGELVELLVWEQAVGQEDGCVQAAAVVAAVDTDDDGALELVSSAVCEAPRVDLHLGALLGGALRSPTYLEGVAQESGVAVGLTGAEGRLVLALDAGASRQAAVLLHEGPTSGRRGFWEEPVATYLASVTPRVHLAGDLLGGGHELLLIAQPGRVGGEVAVVDPSASGLWELDRLEGVWRSEGSSDGLGETLASAQNLQGQGRGVSVLGAPRFARDSALQVGKVYIAATVPTEPSSVGALPAIEGSTPNLGLGTAMAGLGDVSGDGVGDLAVSDARGQVYVFLGPIEGTVTEAAAAVVLSGAPADAAGAALLALDLDGDGLMDLAVAEPGAHDGAGQVSVVPVAELLQSLAL